jgi:glycosyltransferase involved in cell wall biosynthesis
MRSALPGVVHAEVIPNGVDLDKFAPAPMMAARRALGWCTQGDILLFAGDPDEPRKNFTLARAVEAQLRLRGFDVQLQCMYGRAQTAVVQAMNASNVLLLPSFHEGSPNVVKEAMACSLPVVAAPVGDCAQRLRGCTPSAVVERTAGAFTDAAASVLAAGNRSNGRECVAELALPAVARRVIAVYERALARQGAH